MNDEKYRLKGEAEDLLCPFLKRGKYCHTDLCMGWRWTGYKREGKLMAVKSDFDHLTRTETVHKTIWTHGCCGLIFKEKIENEEI